MWRYVHLYLVCAHQGRCPQRPQAAGVPELGDSGELPKVGAGNWTHILQKSSRVLLTTEPTPRSWLLISQELAFSDEEAGSSFLGAADLHTGSPQVFPSRLLPFAGLTGAVLCSPSLVFAFVLHGTPLESSLIMYASWFITLEYMI